MRAADRAVGSTCMFLGALLCVAAFVFTAFLTNLFGVFRPEESFSMMTPGQSIPPVSAPIWPYFVIVPPCLILGFTGLAIVLGKRWGFQLGTFLGLLAALGGQSGGLFGAALAAYCIVRLFQLFPETPKS